MHRTQGKILKTRRGDDFFTTASARKDKVSEDNADLPLPQEIPIGITFERSAGFSDLDVPASLIPPLINRN